MATATKGRLVTVELPEQGFLSHPQDPEELAGELLLLWLIEQVRERRPLPLST